MKSFAATLGLATALVTVTNAHTLFTTLLIDNVNQGDGTCVRMPKDGATSTDPIASLDSPDMACGKDGETAVAFSCPASAGDKMTFEWRLNPDYSAPGSIDISHKGPCAVYLKQVSDIKTSAAAGPGWFKIWDDGYDETAGKWCTEKVMDNNGLMSVQLPTGLPGGYYLVRPELLALHEADKGDPQFYTGCAQVFIDGTAGTLNVPAQNSVSIPGYVAMGQKSVSFNIWQNPMALPYPIPGPTVFSPSSGDGVKAQSAPTYDKAAVGAVPDNCMLKVDNWCGTEVASYSTSAGCYASATACDNQLSLCYSSAGPTGSGGCKTWEAKCQGIQSTCESGNPTGPPNAGVKLQTPDKALPGPIPAASGVAQGVLASVLPAAGSAAPASPAPAVSVAPVVVAAPVVSAAPVIAQPQDDTNSDDSAAPSPVVSAQPVSPVIAAPDNAGTTLVMVYTTTTVGAAEAVSTTPAASEPKATGTAKSDGDLIISAKGNCGAKSGETCQGSTFGECCSKSGRCGSSRFHCGAGSSSTRGCQADYGVCKGNDGGAVTRKADGASAATTKPTDNQGTGSHFQQTSKKFLGGVFGKYI